MKKKIWLLMIFSLVFSVNSFAADENEHKAMQEQKANSAEFERMKSLAGNWKGSTTEMNGEAKDVEVEYKVTSAGTAVVETIFKGTPHEMTTVYHDNEDGKLTTTHYCAFGNQPQLDLVSADEKNLKFELSPNSNLKDKPHMDSLNLKLEGDELTQTWAGKGFGSDDKQTVITLKRV